MYTFSLKEYAFSFMSPEVGDRIATVASTRYKIQGRPTVWTAFPLLLLPCFVTDGRSLIDLLPIEQRAIVGTNYHSQAGLLQDVAVVVVGVTHGPSALMSLRILILGAVNKFHVGIRPFLETI